MMSVPLRELTDGLKGASTSMVRARRDDTREQLTVADSERTLQISQILETPFQNCR